MRICRIGRYDNHIEFRRPLLALLGAIGAGVRQADPWVSIDELHIVVLGDTRKIDDALRLARKALERSQEVIAVEGESDAEQDILEPMRALAKLVFEPLVPHLGDADRLFLSPDADLRLVPWGALPLSKGKYAIQKYKLFASGCRRAETSNWQLKLISDGKMAQLGEFLSRNGSPQTSAA